MIIRYTPGRASVPLPSLGGSQVRYRPIISVRVSGPTYSILRDGYLDTCSDDVVFPDVVAPRIGVDISTAPQLNVLLAGRGILPCRFAPVLLLITDGISETYEWSAVVGFVAVPQFKPLFGYAGFLQFFDANYRGADREVTILPNVAFPGRRI